MLHARLLTYLDEVVRHGSIRKAADKLNVSASSISRQILAFEEELGTPIFDRATRRLTLTAAGELLIRHIRDTLREMNRVNAAIEQLKGLKRGSLSVALMSGLAANLLPIAAHRFRERHPRVELRLQLMTTGEQIMAAVESGEAEVGLGFDFVRRGAIRVVYAVTGQLGAVMRPDHPLAELSSLKLAECAAYPLAIADTSTAIRPYIDNAMARAGLEPATRIETNSIEIMRHLAMSDDTITFLTPFDCDHELRSRRLTYVPVQEFSRHTQQLMLIESDRRANPLSSVFAEQFRRLIVEIDATHPRATWGESQM